ncbi:MAG TPA: hypothetical protein VFN25_09765 [Dokdonella sp.]|uniref:hypothetical protein n=1 Tax=Dokdonella sp. TaxID=2291710 RepID=UPI002D80F64A|nr:hypothetical protein [Dokdonella sp.]HET9033180.1 hypothetical protein [Dokdonella sp.]
MSKREQEWRLRVDAALASRSAARLILLRRLTGLAFAPFHHSGAPVGEALWRPDTAVFDAISDTANAYLRGVLQTCQTA